MEIKKLVSIIAIIICFILIMINKKIRNKMLIKNFFAVFKSYKTKKTSAYDIVCFFVFPLVISVCIIFGFNFVFSNNIANALLTVFSILFTLLFGIMSLLTSTLNSQDKIKKQISREAFTGVSFSLTQSLFILVLLVIYMTLKEIEFDIICYKIITGIIIALSINMVMILLMVIKRSYVTSISEK